MCTEFYTGPELSVFRIPFKKSKTTIPTIKPTTCVITTWQTKLASTLLQVEFWKASTPVVL